ncbi:MAG: hypothetical protein PEGG_02132 [Paraeggerthella hongkongensis]|uniref:Fic family protein n=1 Tax=Paraeggerthella TaxID=651554 RepID=UPI001C0FBCF9|nr:MULTISPECIES: Fic family protein [Paraeggerthella]MBU5406346.1 Fic family protein [Paraeggerthella hongkongensis]MCD2433029.1 Fic family protein [Paraeggerthella hominis]
MQYFDRQIGQDDLARLIADLASVRAEKDKVNRKKRSGAPYEPKLLCPRNFVLSSETAAVVARAEIAVAKSDCLVEGSAYPLRRLLSRVEGVASVRTNGVKPSYRACCYLDLGSWTHAPAGSARLVKNAARMHAGCTSAQLDASYAAHLVEGAVNFILSDVSQDGDITAAHLEALYRGISEGSYWEKEAGLRSWDYNHRRSPDVDLDMYRPPTAAQLPRFMKDLVQFCNRNSYSPIARSAIAHYQLEATKAFMAGSDQIGRILAILIWRKAGLIEHYMPPFSITPAMTTMRHTRRLEPYLTEHDFVDAGELLAVDEWVYHCARACELSVRIAKVCCREASALTDSWTAQVKGNGIELRKCVRKLMNELIGSPVVSIPFAAELIGSSFSTAARAVSDLVEAGVLRQMGGGGRNRVFEAAEAIALFTRIEGAFLPETPLSREFLIEQSKGTIA